MVKSQCISKGCPFIIKKRDKITMMSYWVCGKTNLNLKIVHICPLEK